MLVACKERLIWPKEDLCGRKQLFAGLCFTSSCVLVAVCRSFDFNGVFRYSMFLHFIYIYT